MNEAGRTPNVSFVSPSPHVKKKPFSFYATPSNDLSENYSSKRTSSMTDTEAPSPEVTLPRNPKTSHHRIQITQIRVAPDRGRKEFKNLPELAESIKEHGLLHPLVVKRNEDKDTLKKNPYELVAGERRYRACIMAQVFQVDVRFFEEMDALEAKAVELEENIQRDNLENFERIELMRQFDELQRELHGHAMRGSSSGEGWSTAKTAEVVGQKPQWTGQQLELARKVKEDPELLARLKGMPLKTAIKEAKRIEDAAETKARVERGALTLHSDLLHGDALTLIKDIKPDSVSLLLSDPPFGLAELEVTEEKGAKGHGSVQTYIQTLRPSDNLSPGQARQLLMKLREEVSRVLVPGGVFALFCKMELAEDIRKAWSLDDQLTCYHTPFIWDKGRPTAPGRGYSFMPSYEMVIYGWKGEDAQRRRMNSDHRDIATFKPVPLKRRTHPFEKPQELLWFLIKQWTNEGDTVLDPFAGSGSTIRACRACRRNGIGFELNEDHFHNGQKLLEELRLEQENGKE